MDAFRSCSPDHDRYQVGDVFELPFIFPDLLGNALCVLCDVFEQYYTTKEFSRVVVADRLTHDLVDNPRLGLWVSHAKSSGFQSLLTAAQLNNGELVDAQLCFEILGPQLKLA